LPVRLIVCGLPVALSLIVSVPVRLPVDVGVKSTEIWQFAPAARLVPQLFVCAKSPLVPIDVMASASAPVLVIAMTCGGEVVLTICDPKSMPDGNSAMPDAFVRIVPAATDDEAPADVVTVSVACTGDEPGVTVDGLNEQVVCGGSAPVLHDSATGLL